MARNRKYQTTATRFAPALRAFLLCALIGGSGVGYVWQKSRIDGLSKQIKDREQKLGALEASNEKLRKQLATLRSPAQLDRRVKELNLGLAPVLPNKVWRLTEPVPDPPVELPASVQYASGAATATP